jgi:hypothetical protein
VGCGRGCLAVAVVIDRLLSAVLWVGLAMMVVSLLGLLAILATMGVWGMAQ